MRGIALISLSLSLALPVTAHADCEADFSVNDFIGAMNKADNALEEFDLDLYRNVLDLTYGKLPCTPDRLHPNHLIRFARMNALAAFFDQDEFTVERWSSIAGATTDFPWPESFDEDHPLRATLADYPPGEPTGPDDAHLYPPRNGGVLVNGWLALKPKAPPDTPNFVQVIDSDGLVVDSFWMEGPNFPEKLLRGDDGNLKEPSWWSAPDMSLNPAVDVKIDPAEIARREKAAKERQAEKEREEARLRALQESAAKAAEKQRKRQERIAKREARKAERRRRRAERRGEIEITEGAPLPPPETWVSIDVDKTEAFTGLLALETEELDIECNDLLSLEPKALLGRLTEVEVACLERSLRHARRQVERDKISRVLVADAWAKGKMHRWEAAMRRHLNDIDRSDADLCYIFARFLAEQGPDRASETIRWSEIALANKERWAGDLRTERVYALLRLRAIAAQKRWYQAERHFLDDPTKSRQALAGRWRSRTKTLAREWLDYANHSEVNMDGSLAFQICFSAAGTQDFCDYRRPDVAALNEDDE
ncbi:MAG: hypothetical protein EA397_19005 [Deltaproteobacteria bacterium]|nr:MAG: hypothetical protein EA397_19005 [Deltaproteobacteria bacterium]